MTPSSSTESTGKGQSSAEPASKHKPSAQPASKGQPSAQSASKDQHSGESASKDSKPGDGVPKPKLHGESAMRQAYIDLFKAIPAIFNTGSNSPSLVVAMDEAHPLREPQKHFLPSHILTRAISSLSQSHPEVPFWFVFASTTSKVADFSAPADMHASSRVSIGGKLLFPPYYDFGWDQYGLALAAVEPEKVAQFSHIVRLGRPLWYSLAESNMEVSQVLQTAGQKLCGQSKFEPSNLHHVLAVVGQRFLLDICLGSHDWVQFHQIGVSSHLRVCLWMSEDRKLMETAYPSEPLLSSAAARLLYPPAVPITSGAFLGVLGAALGQLQVAVASRVIDQGLKGELVSRLIFLTAKDITTRKYHAASSVGMSAIPSMSEELLDCKPLPVIEYLTVLFGENTLDQEARRLFDGWHVNFSHWIGMDQNIAFQDAPEAESNSGAEFNPVTEMQEWLLCLWTRTSAVQCCHGQPSFDKVIPMYRLRKPSEPRSDADPDAGRVSFILISDKNKGQAATKYAVGNVTPQDSRLPTLGQPYVAILADLGAAEEPTISRTHGQRSALWIHAFGSGPRTYPFLTGTIADVVRDILHMWHPRDDPSPSQERLKELVRFSCSSERSARRWWEHSK
ncbi:hypothetical protein FS749_005544 [Ceratobasidium sp. UAMH 11750]|nr:hypothetical protein FS749_005544 [Ceratobasidium sp. UAMH 11750]